MNFKIGIKSIGTALALCLALIGFSGSAAMADESGTNDCSGGVDVRVSAGMFSPRGMHLDDTTHTLGIHAEWDIDDTFNLRLGFEYVEPGVGDGSTLKMARFPFMVVLPLRKATPLRNYYAGFGVVHTVAHYSDGHFPDVNKAGPAALIGVKLTDDWRAELMFDRMKKYGREYDGYTLNIVYDGF